RHDVPRRCRGDPAQHAPAHGRAGAVLPAPGASAAAGHRAIAAHHPRRLRAVAVLVLRRADAAHRAHQRHGRHPDVDTARHGGARLRADPCLRDLRADPPGGAATDDAPGRRSRDQAMTFALVVVPITLLLLGFPLLMVLLTT